MRETEGILTEFSPAFFPKSGVGTIICDDGKEYPVNQKDILLFADYPLPYPVKFYLRRNKKQNLHAIEVKPDFSQLPPGTKVIPNMSGGMLALQYVDHANQKKLQRLYALEKYCYQTIIIDGTYSGRAEGHLWSVYIKDIFILSDEYEYIDHVLFKDHMNPIENPWWSQFWNSLPLNTKVRIIGNVYHYYSKEGFVRYGINPVQPPYIHMTA